MEKIILSKKVSGDPCASEKYVNIFLRRPTLVAIVEINEDPVVGIVSAVSVQIDGMGVDGALEGDDLTVREAMRADQRPILAAQVEEESI